MKGEAGSRVDRTCSRRHLDVCPVAFNNTNTDHWSLDTNVVLAADKVDQDPYSCVELKRCEAAGGVVLMSRQAVLRIHRTAR
jgi:hypothetical protein